MVAITGELTDQLLGYVNDEVASAPVELETDLLLTGAVDSIGVMRITQWMEETYGFDVEPIDVTLENFQTVARMLAYLNKKVDQP